MRRKKRPKLRITITDRRVIMGSHRGIQDGKGQGMI